MGLTVSREQARAALNQNSEDFVKAGRDLLMASLGQVMPVALAASSVLPMEPSEQEVALQGRWTITTSAQFQDLGVTVSGSRIIWLDPKYDEESLVLKGSQLCINVNRLEQVNGNTASWKNESTGEILVWHRS